VNPGRATIKVPAATAMVTAAAIATRYAVGTPVTGRSPDHHQRRRCDCRLVRLRISSRYGGVPS
jgi:hypothetical protein